YLERLVTLQRVKKPGQDNDPSRAPAGPGAAGRAENATKPDQDDLMKALGEVLPVERLWISSPVEGPVRAFKEPLQPGSAVTKGQELIQVTDPQRKQESWIRSPVSGIVLSLHFREALMNRQVKPGQPLLCIGYANADRAKEVPGRQSNLPARELPNLVMR